MISGRSLRLSAALAFAALINLGCSVSEQLQGYLGSINNGKPTLTLSSAPATEGTNVDVVLTLSQALPSNLTVNFSLTDVTATDGVDYTSVPSPVVILAGQTSATVSFATAADATFEGDETFTFTVLANAEVNVTTATQVVTIQDATAAPVVVFSSATSSVAESVGTVQVVVTLTPASTVAATVGYTLSGTATDVTDYAASPSTVTFAAGETSKTISVSIVDDALIEPNETIIFNLVTPSNATIGTTSTHTLTIEFSDAAASTWTGLGGDNLWSNPLNWLSQELPAIASSVYFRGDACIGAACNVTIDQNVLVSGIYLDSATNYTGVVTQGNYTVYAMVFSVTSGTFQGSTATISAVDFIVTGAGTFLAGAQILDISSNINIEDGPSDLTGSTVLTDEMTAFAVLSGTEPFWNLTFSRSWVLTVTAPSIRVLNKLIINPLGTAGVFDAAVAPLPIYVGGDLEIINSDTNVTGEVEFIMDGLGNQLISGTLGEVVNTIIVNKPSGTLELSGTIDIANNFTLTSGTMDPGTSHVRFVGNVNSTVTTGGAGVVFNDLTILKTSGADFGVTGTTISIYGKTTVNSTGTNAWVTGMFIMSGDLSIISNSGASPFYYFVGDQDQTIEQTGGIINLTVTVMKTAGVVRQLSNVSMDNALYIYGATWDMNGHNLTTSSILNMQPGSVLYKGCGVLSYMVAGSVLSGTIYNGKRVTINIADAADVSENDISDINQMFVVNITPTNCVPTTFDFATANGTAVAPGDYTAIGTTAVTIGSGISSYTVTVVTKPDNLSEATEYYSVILSNIMAGTAIGDIVGRGEILDDEGGAVNDISAGNLTTTSITSDGFVAHLDFVGDDNANAAVQLYWCNATDYPSCDPTVPSGTSQGTVAMVRGAGEFTATITGLLYPNDGGEVLNIRAVPSDVDGINSSAINSTVTLLPYLDLQESSYSEGSSAYMTVKLNRATLQDVIIDWSISGGGTATAGSDFTVNSGSVTIKAGELSALAGNIWINNDVISEPTEYLNVSVSTTSPVTLRAATSLLRIIDDDSPTSWVSGLVGSVETVKVQDDGKKLLGGYFYSWDNTINMGAVRIQPNGAEDISFQTGTGFNNYVHSWVVLPDGQYLVGGSFSKYNNNSTPYLVKLKSDGSLDSSFALTGTGLNGEVQDIAVQSDGRIIIGGYFTSYNGSPAPYLMRLHADGSQDTSFVQAGTGLSWPVHSLEILNNGKIVIGGQFYQYNSINVNYLTRINIDGSLDTSFVQTGTGLCCGVEQLSIQPDNKILVSPVGDYNGTTLNQIARINSDGSLDTTFTHTGTGLNGYVRDHVLQPDGKVLVAGDFTSYNGVNRQYLARLNSNGSLDTAFVQTGTGIHQDPAFVGEVRTLGLQADGKVVATGAFTDYNGIARGNIVRLNSDGSLDAGFAPPGPGLQGYIQELKIVSDGRMFAAGGYFKTYAGQTVPKSLLRLNTDGSLDTTFIQVGTGFDSSVMAIDLQSDGKIVVGGYFDEYNGITRKYIARMNTDGTLDTTFTQTGSGLSLFVRAIAIQADGKIMVGGSFTSYNASSRKYLARLNSDGSLDGTFVHSGTGLNSTVTALDIQSDGKIVVGGNFTSYNAISRPRLTRIDSNGSLDTTFVQVGSGLDNTVYSLALYSDGRMLVGGSFTNYNGSAANRVARINADGTLDTSFATTGTGFNGWVYAVQLQEDNKIVVGGTLNSYNGSYAPGLARLLPDGALDTSFVYFDSTFSGQINALAVQSDGILSVAGDFLTSNVSLFKAFQPPNTISVGSISVSNITQTGFKATVGYHGDYDENATFTLKWCNQTDNAGCTPANDTPMTWVSGQTKFEVTVSGLSSPNDPGDTLKLQIDVVDPDGVEGAPGNGTVTLLP